MAPKRALAINYPQYHRIGVAIGDAAIDIVLKSRWNHSSNHKDTRARAASVFFEHHVAAPALKRDFKAEQRIRDAVLASLPKHWELVKIAPVFPKTKRSINFYDFYIFVVLTRDGKTETLYFPYNVKFGDSDKGACLSGETLQFVLGIVTHPDLVKRGKKARVRRMQHMVSNYIKEHQGFYPSGDFDTSHHYALAPVSDYFIVSFRRTQENGVWADSGTVSSVLSTPPAKMWFVDSERWPGTWKFFRSSKGEPLAVIPCVALNHQWSTSCGHNHDVGFRRLELARRIRGGNTKDAIDAIAAYYGIPEEELPEFEEALLEFIASRGK